MSNGTPSIRDRVAGGLVALVVGDAIALGTRHRRAGNGGGRILGPWSFHAALAMATTASLVERGWDLDDAMERFRRCWDRGEETADGRVLAAGAATREAILRYGAGAGVLEAGVEAGRAVGCGALPRVFPAALHAAAESREEGLLRCRDAASLTHAHDRVTGCCGAYGLILRGVLGGKPIAQAVEEAASGSRGWVSEAARERLGAALDEDPLPAPAIDEPVDEALPAAVRCAARHEGDLEGAIAAAVARGGRAEVVAAVAGSLVGTRVGMVGVPARWLDALPRSGHVRWRAGSLGEVVARRLERGG